MARVRSDSVFLHVGRVNLVPVRVFIFSRCVLTIYGATKSVTSLSGFQIVCFEPFDRLLRSETRLLRSVRKHRLGSRLGGMLRRCSQKDSVLTIRCLPKLTDPFTEC